MDITIKKIERLRKLLNSKGKKILVVSHYNPDGDAIGSILAVSHYLRKKGHYPVSLSPDPFPDFLNWLPGSNEIAIYNKDEKRLTQIIQEVDIIIMVDFNDPDRLDHINNEIKNSGSIKILIDHHPNPEDFADIVFSDITVSSSAELIYKVLFELEGKRFLDESVAICLFTGIITDTGCFSFNSSNPETYEIVAELLRYNVDKDRIFSNLYENFSQNRMRLLGYCLYNNMIVIDKYNTAYISLSREELRKFDYIPGDTEGFVNLPFSIKDIKFIALLIEKDDHVKLSFRSKGCFSANSFAIKHFEGGGHKNASGGKSKLSLKETIDKFVNLLPEYQHELQDAP